MTHSRVTFSPLLSINIIEIINNCNIGMIMEGSSDVQEWAEPQQPPAVVVKTRRKKTSNSHHRKTSKDVQEMVEGSQGEAPSIAEEGAPHEEVEAKQAGWDVAIPEEDPVQLDNALALLPELDESPEDEGAVKRSAGPKAPRKHRPVDFIFLGVHGKTK